ALERRGLVEERERDDLRPRPPRRAPGPEGSGPDEDDPRTVREALLSGLVGPGCGATRVRATQRRGARRGSAGAARRMATRRRLGTHLRGALAAGTRRSVPAREQDRRVPRDGRARMSSLLTP